MALNYKRFIANGTWTAPSGVTKVILLGQAGGCGGCSGLTGSFAPDESDLRYGTLLSQTFADVTPNTTYSITIGSGGAGGIGNSSDFVPGDYGQSTFFGSVEFAGGENPGPMVVVGAALTAAQGNAMYDSGSTGTSSGGNLGGIGAPGTSEGVGANGGNGSSGSTGGNGSNASFPGGMGGNGGNGSTTGGNGGAGAAGQLYVIWVD